MVPGPRLAIPVLLALTLASVLAGSQAAARSTPPVRSSAATAVASSLADSFRSPRTYAAVAVPARLRVPAARVDTALEQLGRAPDGGVAVPKSPYVAGWYAQGPRPGQPGPAVIVGHVDSKAGPGVFFHLVELMPGAEISVDATDGTTRSFRVTTITRVPKTDFPTEEVYSPTLEPSLRLVTCGGLFNHTAGEYRDNVIVFAVPA
jgi:hypothetical protein